jgi:hypothetical protein
MWASSFDPNNKSRSVAAGFLNLSPSYLFSTNTRFWLSSNPNEDLTVLLSFKDLNSGINLKVGKS